LQKYITAKIYYIVISLLIIVFSSDIGSNAADPKRIALLPFKINSAQDLSFLKDGIFDMFTSRLTQEGRVEVLSREQVEGAVQTEAASGTINETTARRIGTRLKADFVLFGSLTVLGENMSIDVKMVDIAGGKPTMTFFDQSQDLGAVITKINLIAADINDKMLGRPRVAAPAKAPSASAAAPAAKPVPPQKSSVYDHPEKVLREDGFITQGDTEETATLGIDRRTAKGSQSRFWKSASFRHLINGVALGDVDGDGQIETMAITPHDLLIYRSNGGAFRKIAEIKQSHNKNLIGVDAADINENGYAEIFVTSLNAQREVVNSFVVEYDGKQFNTIIDNSHHYYRVADTSSRGKILLGQRPSIRKPSAGAINELRWQDSDYLPTDPIRAPRNTNLMGLSVGDVLNDGREIAVAYKENDHFQVLDSSGKRLWDSGERFGGSMIYGSIALDYRGQVQNKWYFPLRLVVWYNPAKKETEVIAAQNHDLIGGGLQEFRYFNKTHLSGYTWDGVGLGPSWKTRRLTGYIQDFAVGDFDNDGQDELVVALVMEEGRVALVTEAKSTIIGYELAGPAE
jgi:TolB-like protein